MLVGYIHEGAERIAALLCSERVLVDRAIDAYEECRPCDEAGELTGSEEEQDSGERGGNEGVTSPIPSDHD